MESPYIGRAIIDERFDGVKISIPVKRNWFLIIFLSFWLCGWLAGEIFASKSAFGLGGAGVADAFLLIWLVGWSVGGFFAVRTWLWNLIGNEIILAEQGVLTIDKKGVLFYQPKTYDLNEAKNFRAEETYMENSFFGSKRTTNFWNMDSNGTIKFDYGLQTIKFGNNLYEAEANYILQKLRSKKIIN